ncbi:MAG: hypothetical protein Q4P16_07005 [Spirochaetales bacterium]|nr:hypothetical protein [Spirochaetales bacterium]
MFIKIYGFLFAGKTHKDKRETSMFIKIYDEIPQEAKAIREAVFVKEQGFK